MGVSAAITVTMRRSIRLCWRLTGTTFLRRVRTGGKTPRQAENLHDYADREFDYYKTGAELTIERAESDGWTVGQDEERLDDCPLIVLAVSLAAGPRSLQLDTHGANLALRAGKYVEAVPETGPAPAVVAATGSTFADTTSGEFGARFAVSPDEPICDGGAYYSDQSDAHDHDDRRPRRVVTMAHQIASRKVVMVAPVALYSTRHLRKALTNTTAITMVTIDPAIFSVPTDARP